MASQVRTQRDAPPSVEGGRARREQARHPVAQLVQELQGSPAAEQSDAQRRLPGDGDEPHRAFVDRRDGAQGLGPGGILAGRPGADEEANQPARESAGSLQGGASERAARRVPDEPLEERVEGLGGEGAHVDRLGPGRRLGALDDHDPLDPSDARGAEPTLREAGRGLDQVHHRGHERRLAPWLRPEVRGDRLLAGSPPGLEASDGLPDEPASARALGPHDGHQAALVEAADEALHQLFLGLEVGKRARRERALLR